MKKMIILQPEMCVGGVERVLLTLLKNLDKEKFDITVMLLNKNVWDDQIPKEIKIKYMFNKNPREYNSLFKRIYKYSRMFVPGKIIQKIFLKDKYDIYISFHEPMIYFLRGAKGKKVSWIHADYTIIDDITEIKQLGKRMSFLSKTILKKRVEALKNCDKIICVAETARKGFLNKFDIDEEKVVVRYNPNDIERIKSLANNNQKIQEEIKYSKDVINFCAVGRLSHEKAFERLISITLKLKNEGYLFHFNIIGDGPEYQKLEKAINDNNLNDYIHLIGYDANPYKYMSKSDFVICSSKFEAYSTVVTESIILGIPVIATECSGMAEIFGHTNAGLITKNNTEDLYYAIKKVLNDKKLRALMKLEAIERSKYFDTKRMVCEIESLLLE
ncbi:glycosyltransferase involved in cell wall biosynthesis [Planomicrobium soli]|uniref:Glycosyltransferase involved in cell wall biosynthesis n=1 Tax=Planomicrobium soli TaxID=1176648 RepID=A0A2P8H3A9_9BACL|nr:glycosyltransferase [Planomicrobium soli]PSL40701.1 glycosyltransferase involved in cell wall biosynthesis [Planomicrobium soli]